MAEGLQTPDGKKLDLEAAEKTFAEAMAQPETDVPAPRKMTAEQKKQSGMSLSAPGHAQPRLIRLGLPAKSEKVDKDFSEDIQGITTGLWLTAASIPPVQAYAALVKLNQPALVHR